jgi:hypothetical protein
MTVEGQSGAEPDVDGKTHLGYRPSLAMNFQRRGEADGKRDLRRLRRRRDANTEHAERNQVLSTPLSVGANMWGGAHTNRVCQHKPEQCRTARSGRLAGSRSQVSRRLCLPALSLGGRWPRPLSRSRVFKRVAPIRSDPLLVELRRPCRSNPRCGATRHGISLRQEHRSLLLAARGR